LTPGHPGISAVGCRFSQWQVRPIHSSRCQQLKEREITKQILIVEDNPADARLLEEVFRMAAIKTERSVVRDGEEAMAFLRRQGQYHTVSRPDLILLDLNMPKKDGRDVVSEIQSDHDLAGIPLVVMSGSRDLEEMARLEAEGVAQALIKPSDLDEYVMKVSALLQCLV
jgi:CheY-like chemotaxis protein